MGIIFILIYVTIILCLKIIDYNMLFNCQNLLSLQLQFNNLIPIKNVNTVCCTCIFCE